MRGRTIILALLATLAVVYPTAAQDQTAPIRKELKDLAIQPAEVDAIERILEKDEAAVILAQGDLKVLQAQLERLMLEKEPPMTDIRKLLEQSLRIEMSLRLIRIERTIALRKLLGDRRWAVLERLGRVYTLAKRSGKLPDRLSGFDEPVLRLIQLLDRLQ